MHMILIVLLSFEYVKLFYQFTPIDKIGLSDRTLPDFVFILCFSFPKLVENSVVFIISHHS